MRKIPISLFQTQKSTDKHTNNIKNVFFSIHFVCSLFFSLYDRAKANDLWIRKNVVEIQRYVAIKCMTQA